MAAWTSWDGLCLRTVPFGGHLVIWSTCFLEYEWCLSERGEEAGTEGLRGDCTLANLLCQGHFRPPGCAASLWSSLWTTVQVILKKHNPDLVTTLMKTQMSPCHCKVTTLWWPPATPTPFRMKPRFLCVPCKALEVWPCCPSASALLRPSHWELQT